MQTMYDPIGINGVGVDFGVLLDGQVIPCRISYEALSDHFKSGNSPAQMVQCYIDNRDRIDGKATAMFRIATAMRNAQFTKANPLLIRTGYL